MPVPSSDYNIVGTRYDFSSDLPISNLAPTDANSFKFYSNIPPNELPKFDNVKIVEPRVSTGPVFNGSGSEDYFEADVDPGHDLKIEDPNAPELPLIRPAYPVIAQMVVGFAIGIMFSPWSVGIEFVLAFAISYELLIYVITEGKAPYWNTIDRIAIVACYLLGWIIGRILAGFRDPFYDSILVVGPQATLTPSSPIITSVTYR